MKNSGQKLKFVIFTVIFFQFFLLDSLANVNVTVRKHFRRDRPSSEGAFTLVQFRNSAKPRGTSQFAFQNKFYLTDVNKKPILLKEIFVNKWFLFPNTVNNKNTDTQGLMQQKYASASLFQELFQAVASCVENGTLETVNPNVTTTKTLQCTENHSEVLFEKLIEVARESKSSSLYKVVSLFSKPRGYGRWKGLGYSDLFALLGIRDFSCPSKQSCTIRGISENNGSLKVRVISAFTKYGNNTTAKMLAEYKGEKWEPPMLAEEHEAIDSNKNEAERAPASNNQ